MPITFTNSAAINNPIMRRVGKARNLIADGALQYYGYGDQHGLSALTGSWSISGGSRYTNSNGSSKLTYRALHSWKWDAGSYLGMMTQSMPTPEANHKYYGAIWYRSEGTAADNRFEWYLNDNSSVTTETETTRTNCTNLMFHGKGNTGGNWFLGSGVRQAASYTSGSWTIRNFVVNPTGTFYIGRMLIFDITEMFGTSLANAYNNTFWKQWCDKYVREHWSFCGFPGNNPLLSVTPTFSGGWTGYVRGWRYYNTYNMPRDVLMETGLSGTAGEVYIYYPCMSYVQNHVYYFRCHAKQPGAWNGNKTNDLYFPIAEPCIMQGAKICGSSSPWQGRYYASTRSADGWDVQSAVRTQTISGSSTQFRFDFNNGGSNLGNNYYADMVLFDLSSSSTLMLHMETVRSSSTSYPRPSGMAHPRGTLLAGLTRAALDRWLDGWSQPFIECPYPTPFTMIHNTSSILTCDGDLRNRSYSGDYIKCADVIPIDVSNSITINPDGIIYATNFDGYVYQSETTF